MFFHNYWTKTFSDSTQETGTDPLIDSGFASWTNGRLEDLIEVSLSFFPRIITTKIPSEYHQFDRFLAEIDVGNRILPVRVARVLQAKITNDHLGQHLLYNIIRNNAYLLITSQPTQTSIPITKDLIDKWATVVLTKKGFFFDFCPKGRIKWEQVSI
jgi:hypothetical protein